MNSIIDKLKNHRHRRTGSSCSNASNLSTISSSDGITSPSQPEMNESPSFCPTNATLKLLDDEQLVQSACGSQTQSDAVEGDLGEPSKAGLLLAGRRSRLPRNIRDILKDYNALPYFKEYMHHRQLVHLLKFWLDAESFRVGSESALSTLYNQADTSTSDSVDSGVSDCKQTDSKCAIIKMMEQDAVNIFTKYISRDSRHNIQVTKQIQDAVIKRICGENGRLYADCFVPAQDFVLKIMDNRYFPDFLGSVYYCRLQIDVLTGPDVRLADIIYNECTLSVLTEFLDLEGERHMIEFWLAAESFRQDLEARDGVYSDTQAQSDAITLYEKYISMQATSPLGLDERVRINVENEICSENGIRPHCFEAAQRVVLNHVEQKYLRTFLNSQIFSRYLTDMWHTIENTPELPDPLRPRGITGSTSSTSVTSVQSDPSFLQYRLRNTLLANADSSPQSIARRRQLSFDHGQLDIDSVLGDESLTNKKQGDNVKFARIDRLGRYVREFDTTAMTENSLPEGKRMKIKASVNKLLRKNTTEEDEIAAQVAALIVSDITQMTANANNFS